MTAPLRVLFFDHTAALSGGEIALLHLVQSLDPRLVIPLVVTGADGPLVEKLRPYARTDVLPLPSNVAKTNKDKLGILTLFRVREISSSILYIFRLARYIREQKIHIVHTNSLKADFLGGIAGRIAGRPVIWHVRDRITDDYLPRPIVQLFKFLRLILPTHTIAVSDAVRRTLLSPKMLEDPSSDFSKFPHAQLTVIHDGTVLPTIPVVSDQPVILRIGLIGRISPWKGQHIFLQAAALVLKRFPDVQFLIVGAPLFGEDAYDQEVTALPQQLGIEKNVLFTGFCDDVSQLIATLTLLVHASTTPEPFGQVIIEGMAAAKPVVATNGGGVPEIVEDGLTGILVSMGDAPAMAEAICKILEAPARAQEMGIRGRQRVENHFTVVLTARRVEALYAQISPPNI